MKIGIALPWSLLTLGVFCLLLGILDRPAWALGPGAPPIIKAATVQIYTRNDAAPMLLADLEIEVPGGLVPQDIASVTVLVPGEATPRLIPRSASDLAPDRSFQLNLTAAGLVGFPTGTYTFTATDTAGGSSVATDTLGSSTPLVAPTITSHANNQIIASTSPTISWDAVPGALTYRVGVRNGYMDQFLFSRYTTGTSLTLPSGVLVRGRRFQIFVDTFDHINGTGCGTPGCTGMDANAKARRYTEAEIQGPDIFLTFPSSNYTAGQTLDITARVWNTHAPVTVDAVVWVGIPGTANPIEVLEFKNVFLPQNLSGDVYNGPLGFSYTFNGSEPNGVYVVGFRLLDPSSGETIAVTTRTFTKS